MTFYSYLSVVPVVLRALSLLLVYKFISTVLGTVAVVEYASVNVLTSVATSLALGGSANFIVGYIKNSQTISSRLARKLFVLSGIAFFFLTLIFTLSKYFELTTPFRYGILNEFGIISAVFIFSSIFICINSIFLGELNEKRHFASSLSAALGYLTGVVAIGFSGSNFLLIWGLIGFPFCAMVSATSVYLFFNTPRTNLQLKLRKFDSGGLYSDIVPVCVLSLSSSIANTVFMYGWMNTGARYGLDVTADVVALLRFTDVVGVLVGPFISTAVFPRISGWKQSEESRIIINRWYWRILLFSGLCMTCIFFNHTLISNLLFSRELTSNFYFLVIFMLAEVFRISSPLYGYALIDGRFIWMYLTHEMIVKISVGALVYFLSFYYSILYMAIVYLTIAFFSSLWLTLFFSKKLSSEKRNR